MGEDERCFEKIVSKLIDSKEKHDWVDNSPIEFNDLRRV